MIRVSDLYCRAGEFALSVSLEIPRGEYFVLLGPTGSGKTLLLECICGLRRIRGKVGIAGRGVSGPARRIRGKVEIAGRDVTRAEPRHRGIGYMPQDGALFPHLTVAENIAFAPRMRGVRRAKRQATARRFAELVGIAPLLERSVAGLSGGERQRVAMARALAAEPKALLLDEPVSALDGETRDAILSELRRIQRRRATTTLHVCHDLDEMDRVADRVGILHGGQVVQVGSPRDVRGSPASAAVARLLRLGAVLTGRASTRGDGSLIDLGDFTVRAPGRFDGEVEVLVRSRGVELSTPADKPDAPRGRVRAVLWRDLTATVELVVGKVLLTAEIPRSRAEALRLSESAEAAVTIGPEAVRVFPRSGGRG